ncbi:Protein FAM69C [Amphibalanus amphitrite]|uniref:Protein FAM69C n=2 Tax=Amphibalanus amphitrite TaxID=1232801 RepID=A0A6A4WQG0_AMPAM|nr:Protein FAM69C [Amphibalanus amphitrite]
MLTKEYTQSLLPVDEEPPEVFQDMLQGLVAFELNGRDNLDILSLLWPWHNSSSIITGQNSQLLEQIVRFAHNDEYKLMQLYSDLQLFPRVLGTCGDIYVVEHMTLLLDRPLLDLFPALTDTCHVTRSARRILHYLLHLSSVLPLHLCDLQWGHFGADSAGRVRFVDLDAAFSAEKMAATQRETVCSTDEDCDFFDCRGTCDVAQGRCLGGVSDNVSNLCRQLVWARAPLLGAQRRLGLLAAVLSEQQAELLERCARSRTAEHAQQVAEVLEELERRTCAEPEWETRDTDTDEF